MPYRFIMVIGRPQWPDARTKKHLLQLLCQIDPEKRVRFELMGLEGVRIVTPDGFAEMQSLPKSAPHAE
jgi:hypothetical protein